MITSLVMAWCYNRKHPGGTASGIYTAILPQRVGLTMQHTRTWLTDQYLRFRRWVNPAEGRLCRINKYGVRLSYSHQLGISYEHLVTIRPKPPATLPYKVTDVIEDLTDIFQPVGKVLRVILEKPRVRYHGTEVRLYYTVRVCYQMGGDVVTFVHTCPKDQFLENGEPPGWQLLAIDDVDLRKLTPWLHAKAPVGMGYLSVLEWET